jgi:hypothetical protein
VVFWAAVLFWAPLWLAITLPLILLRVLVLYTVVWSWWIGRARRRALFVYSDSPNWKEYLEADVLPKLPASAVVLNWSRRQSWSRFNFSVLLFRYFAGEREFNPIGFVFERFHLVKRYRFWQPFRDAKHGRPEALQAAVAQFLKPAKE